MEDQLTTFSNVDLRIRVKSGMKELLEAFGSSVVVLNNVPEDEFASLEYHIYPKTIDEAIGRYAELIKTLPPSARNIWESAESRCMSIGILAGELPHQKIFDLSEKTISVLATMRTEVAICVYGTGQSGRSTVSKGPE
jgi:hypothetical protein